MPSYLIAPLLWTIFVLCFVAYRFGIRNFSDAIGAEDPELWDTLRRQQDSEQPPNPGKIVLGFLRRGRLHGMTRGVSRAAFLFGITAVISGLSASVLCWYYFLYLPYQK